MGKLQSRSGGYYLLECRIANVTVKKAFMQADKSVEDIAALPLTDDFYLNIPDQPTQKVDD